MTLTHRRAKAARHHPHLRLRPLFGLEDATIPRHEFPEGELPPGGLRLRSKLA